MRKQVLSIFLGLTLSGGTAALAGPSTHELGRAGRQPEGTGRVAQVPARSDRPYRLTGEQRDLKRVVVYRDVPAGRGQTQRLPFLVTIEE